MPNSPSRDGNANIHNRKVTPKSELHSTAPSRVSGPPKHTVPSGSSSQGQNTTQVPVPGVSSPLSDPQSASMPSSSQSSSQLGLTGAPSGHIRTTLATLPNEQQARELPGKVDPVFPYSGDTSRGMTSPDEQRDAGPSAAPSGVLASESSKHTVTSSGSSSRRQKSAQAPYPSSPSLDPLPTSTPSRLNEPQKLPGGVLLEFPDPGIESRGIVPCDEQRDAGPSELPAPSRLSGSSKQTVTLSESSFMCQEPTDAPCLSSPSLNPLPTSTPSRQNEPQEPPDRVLPELSDSGNESRGIALCDERHDVDPSAVVPNSAPASPKHVFASSNASSVRHEPAQAPFFSSPCLNQPPPSTPSSSQSPPRPTLMQASSNHIRGTRAALSNEPQESSGRVLPDSTFPGNEIATQTPSDHILTNQVMSPNGARPKSPYSGSGDGSKRIGPPDEQCHAGPSVESIKVPVSQKHIVVSPESPSPRLESPPPPRTDNDPHQIPPTHDSQAISHIPLPSTSPSYEISSHRPESHRSLKRPDFPLSGENANEHNCKVTPSGSPSLVSGASNYTGPSGTFFPSQGRAQTPYRPSPPSDPLLASAPSSSQSSPSRLSLTSAPSGHVCTTRVMPPDELQEQPSGGKRGGIAPPDKQPHAGPAASSSVPDAPQDIVNPKSSSLHQELTLPELPSYSGDESGGIALSDERRHTNPAAASYWAPESPNQIVTFAESEPQGGSMNGIMWEMLR